MKIKYGLFAAVVLAMGTFAGMADTIVNLNTGVNSSGVMLPTGTADPKWTVAAPSSSAVPATAYEGPPPFLAGNIGPKPIYNAAGEYTYAVNFGFANVAGLTYTLSASVWADDAITAVSFGDPLGTMTPLTFNSGPDGSIIFTTSDQGLFGTGSGSKTLMLTVNNAVLNSSTSVRLIGGVTAVPEASEWAMLIGAAGLGLLYYRKQLVALTQREAPAAL